jgi:alanyl-tRNA synthetase
MKKMITGAEIRQSFIDFFVQRGHTFVASSSLVPGGDQTLLFTNAGMVQFKDVFLGTDHRPYSRATNSQKCMRVAGKHNDLDDVGRDDTHHTFFEMLGNWSFGDYYKKDAIAWAWELLTDVWGLDRSVLWTTCFKDDKGNIPADEEAAEIWKQQPGIDPQHVLYFGRNENFWEMAETGPCGPCSEIHIDRGIAMCDKQHIPGHVCSVNGDCRRYTELWNLVFIQYNRISPTELLPLPATHVDTGMGFERVVSVIQGVDSNYRTDLLLPLVEKVRELTGQTVGQREANMTPYRVIADHARAAAFLIADGVIPGNVGRNYVCRMIIRRAARFGSKIGLNQPFLAAVAAVMIDNYGVAYPEVKGSRNTILTHLTREEERFQRTVESGVSHLDDLLEDLKELGGKVLDGGKAFELYATHGLPLELTRDIAREQDLDVDEEGFKLAMEEHRLASGAGKAIGAMGGEDVDIYRAILADLIVEGKLSATEGGSGGVDYEPYHVLEVEGEVLTLIRDGLVLDEVHEGDRVEVILPRTCFYIESGGQVSDTGTIVSVNQPHWEIAIREMRRPAAGVIVHVGDVIRGVPRRGDRAIAAVDAPRRHDTMRNHTATHLLHAELHTVLGEHARQAGSLVAPERLRFDFDHPQAVTAQELEIIEAGVNRVIMDDYSLRMVQMPLAKAMEEGATALFGEKYGEEVRTISIGEGKIFSYELCGGTHVTETGDIGLFLITSEGSAAAGVRRIEAVTGRAAYELVQRRSRLLKQAANALNSPVDEIPSKLQALENELDTTRKQVNKLRQELVTAEFGQKIQETPSFSGVPYLVTTLPNADLETLRQMTDRFRQRYANGAVVLASVKDGQPVIVAAIAEDLVKRGLHAGDLVKSIAPLLGGSGGGRPVMAQAGGKDPTRLEEALELAVQYLKCKLG